MAASSSAWAAARGSMIRPPSDKASARPDGVASLPPRLLAGRGLGSPTSAGAASPGARGSGTGSTTASDVGNIGDFEDVRNVGVRLSPVSEAANQDVVVFTDTEGQEIRFELTRGTFFDLYINGRQRMTKIKKVWAEGNRICLEGKKLMGGAKHVLVPRGKEVVLQHVMELFGRRLQTPEDRALGPLKVSILNATNLKNVDTFSVSDPYCTVQVKDRPDTKLTTHYIQNDLNPTWDYVGEISEWTTKDELVFQVMDKEWVLKHKNIGSCTLKLSDKVLPTWSGKICIMEGAGEDKTESYLEVRLSAGTARERVLCNALRDLKQACKDRCLVSLRAALHNAKALDLDGPVIDEAQRLLVVLKHQMEAFERVRVTMKLGTMDDLKEALRLCDHEHVDWKKMPDFQTEVKLILARAVAAGDLGMLQRVLFVARRIGFSEDELSETERKLMTDLRMKEARAAVAKAKVRNELLSVREAYELAVEVGLPQSELDSLAAQMAVLEKQYQHDLILQRITDCCDKWEPRDSVMQAEDPAQVAVAITEFEEVLRPAEEAEINDPIVTRGWKLKEKIEQQLEIRWAIECLSVIIDKNAGMIADAEAAMKLLNAGGPDPSDELKQAMRDARDELCVAVSVVRGLAVSDHEILHRAEKMRKRVNAMLEELKGAIRIIARVRPMIDKEQGADIRNVVRVVDAMTLDLDPEFDPKRSRPPVLNARGEPKAAAAPSRFRFDGVFSPGTQEEIFQDVADLVQSAVGGFNVTLFAYGQTGSGKTHTMFGNQGDPGIAPLAVDCLFDVIGNSEDVRYTVAASACELYLDAIYDPHNKNQLDDAGREMVRFGQQTMELTVSRDKDGEVHIPNLTTRICDTSEKLQKFIFESAKLRQTGKTIKNDRSSRSHLIFMIRVEGTPTDGSPPARSKIVLCDLAGSERTADIKAGTNMVLSQDKQMREASEINKSLSALADVIQALTERSPHVPYRNHKLTTILQDSLGGTAKTLMFVNLSPASSNRSESFSSLSWAVRAKGVQNNIHSKAKGKKKGQEHGDTDGDAGAGGREDDCVEQDQVRRRVATS